MKSPAKTRGPNPWGWFTGDASRDCKVWALSVQKCEFFHADVHAGNLLVLEDKFLSGGDASK